MDSGFVTSSRPGMTELVSQFAAAQTTRFPTGT